MVKTPQHAKPREFVNDDVITTTNSRDIAIGGFRTVPLVSLLYKCGISSTILYHTFTYEYIPIYNLPFWIALPLTLLCFTLLYFTQVIYLLSLFVRTRIGIYVRRRHCMCKGRKSHIRQMIFVVL